MLKILFIIAVIIFLFPTRIKLKIYLDSQKLKGEIFLLLFGLVPLKKKIDYSFSEKNLSPIPAKFPDLPRPSLSLNQGKSFLQLLLKSINIEKFKADLHLSLTDKFHLSLLNGIYWWIWGIFAHRLKKNYQFNFTSEYQNCSSFLTLDGIFSFFCGQIIFNSVCGRNAYSHLLRRFKHGQPSY